MNVSVIITTKNEERNIENCLESIKAQSYPQEKIEIIVVDNNSADKTKEIVKKCKEWLAPLNVQLFNWGPERSAQRNFGISQATGKYILYLDADMVLSKDVINECIDKCEKEDLIALYIPERIIGNGFWIKVRDFERSFYNGTVIDCVRFIRRDKFLEIGGFDENLTGPEDWDFDRRIKKTGKVDIIKSPIYHSEGRFSLQNYLNKKAYYAKSFEKYIQKWSYIDTDNRIKPKNDPIIRKQLGFGYRLWGVFIEDGKWKRLIRHPLLAWGMYVLRSLVGLRYLILRSKVK